MPKCESEPLVRKHVHLFQRDVDRVEALFGHTIGPSKAYRTMIRMMLNQLEAKAAASAKPMGPLNDLDFSAE